MRSGQATLAALKCGVATLLSAFEILLDRSQPDAYLRFQQIDESTLRAAFDDCREFERLEDHGYQEQLRLRHSHLRRYLPAFLKLPFQAEPGTQPLLRAIEIARQLDEAGERALPMEAPTDFMSVAWQNSYKQPDGRVDKRLWDIALALCVRDALRSGDLFLPESRHHVSFANLIYHEQRWRQERTAAYEQLSLFQESDEVVAHLCREFDHTARSAEQGMSQNPFAEADGAPSRNPPLAKLGENASDLFSLPLSSKTARPVRPRRRTAAGFSFAVGQRRSLLASVLTTPNLLFRLTL